MTAISVGGLVLGVAVLILVLSVMNGFERELRERVLSVMPHGVITAQAGFENPAEILGALRKHPEIVEAAPIEEGRGLLVANGVVSGVSFAGVDPVAEKRISSVAKFLREGTLDSLVASDFNILLGASLAATLGVKTGDRVTLVLPEAQVSLAGPIPRTRRFRVAGMFEVGSDADKNFALINLEDALKLAKRRAVHSIRIQAEDLFEVNRILRESMASLKVPGLFANTWMRRHGNLYDAIQTQKTTLLLLLLMLIAVAAFNLVSNLLLFVNEKRADIAILRTMGASTGKVQLLFMAHGLAIGCIGIAGGLVLGLLLATYITEVYVLTDSVFKLGMMDEYFIHYLPSEVLLADVLLISVVSLLICLIATFYPARVAARANPVEALQRE